MASCLQQYSAGDGDGKSLPFTVWFDFYQNGVYYGTLDIDSGETLNVMHTTGATMRIVPTTKVDGWITPEPFEFVACSPKTIVYEKEIPIEAPIITSISWSPKGSFSGVAAGASLTGRYGSTFRVIAVGPSSTPSLAVEEIMAELAGASAAVYKRGDSFMLDGEGYTILHAIDDGECAQAVIAKNISTNQHPAVDESIHFSASINWNDDGATATTRRLEWFYLKPPSESYTKAYADNMNNWTHFATGIMPAHTFTTIDDADIIYLKVIARNKANQTAEFGVGTCSAGLFNLWGGADGFEITVVNATGADDLCIGYATQVPGTNAYLVDPNILRWDDVVNQVYFGARNEIGCAYSVPQPDMCGSYAMIIGHKYAIYMSTSFITVVPGESVFELKSGRTIVTVDRSYMNFLESSVCGFFGVSGDECTSLVAELSDVVFVANYVSLLTTGKDTFGTVRELTWFDHIALPFALIGIISPQLPFGKFVSEGLEGFWKGGEHFSDAAFNWMETVAIAAPGEKIVTEGPWTFMQSIVRISGEHLDEVMGLVHADNFAAAASKLEGYLASDLGDVPYRAFVDFNNALRKYLPLERWEALMDTIYGFAPQADSIIKTASKTSPTADDLADIAHAAGEYKVMDKATLAVYRSLKILDTATPKYIDEVRNVLKNSPKISSELVARHKTILDNVASGKRIISTEEIKALLNHADLAPDDIVGLVKSSDNLALIVNKLTNGSYSQALGNFLDSTKKYWDCVNTQIGKTEADTWVRNNAKTSKKAMAANSPAKMADIPHAVQEVAAEQGELIADYCGGHPASCIGSTSDDLLGTGRTVADELYDEMKDFATTPTNGWEETGKAYAKNVDDRRYGWFSQLSDVNKERAVHGMVGATLVFAAVILVKIYTDAGPQTLNHKIFVQNLEQYYWPCFHACEDKNATTLAAAIEIYEDEINDCGTSLALYKDNLEADGTYTQFLNVLKLHQFNLAHFKACLAGLGPTGTISCTSNQTGFAVYIDDDYIDHSYGNTYLVIPNVAVGSHKVKIEKGSGYTPPHCEDTVTVNEGDITPFDCQMTKIGACSEVYNVKIYIDPLSPAKDETVAFNGAASSNDPIKTWEWDFGDGSPKKTGQAVTHKYTKAGIYTAKLTVTNDCGNSNFATRAITVTEEPVAESTVLIIETAVGTNGDPIPGHWTVEIWVDGKYTKCKGAQTLVFGTDAYCDCESPYKQVPCELGTHTITLKKAGYNDLSKTFTLVKDVPQKWSSPIMTIGPQEHMISFVVPVGSIAYVGGKPLTTTSIGRLSVVLKSLRKR